MSIHTCPIFKNSPHRVGGRPTSCPLSRSNHSSHSSSPPAVHNLLTLMVCLRFVSSWDLLNIPQSPSGAACSICPDSRCRRRRYLRCGMTTNTLTEILVARVSRDGEILVSNPKNVSPKIIFVHDLYVCLLYVSWAPVLSNGTHPFRGTHTRQRLKAREAPGPSAPTRTPDVVG